MRILIYLWLKIIVAESQIGDDLLQMNSGLKPERVVIEITTTTTVTTTEIEEDPFENSKTVALEDPKPVGGRELNLKSSVPIRFFKEEPKLTKCYVLKDNSSDNNAINTLTDMGIQISQYYKKNFNGASFCTEDTEIVGKLRMENVKIEENGIYKISSVQSPISKHLWLMKNYTNSFFNSYFYDNLIFRILQIDKIFRYFKGYYKFYYTGKNVKIYLIDTSVNVRAPNISNLTGKKRSCNSHGDINVDILIDKTRGFARDAEILVLDAVDCEGNIKLSEILALLEIIEKDGRPSILLFGVSGQYSEILNEVVDLISSKGVIVISPAGNNHDNACYHSPSSAKSVLTVGSVDRHTSISKFSNFGSCVRIFSLGQEIYENNRTKGTSHAAANVAGAVAMYLEKHNNASFSDIWAFLDSNSFWNGSYLIFKLPYLSLEYKSQDIKNKENGSSGDNGNLYLVLFIFFALLFILIYCFIKRKRRLRRRDYVIDTNLRNHSIEN